jgi:hypothetical protein
MRLFRKAPNLQLILYTALIADYTHFTALVCSRRLIFGPDPEGTQPRSVGISTVR